MKSYIGIDVSKHSLDVCLLFEDEGIKPKYRKFGNDSDRYGELVAWVTKQSMACESHYCLESTGCYSLGIAMYLASLNMNVSVENPLPIKQFRGVLSLKSKTDKLDSYCIALYTLKMEPRQWHLKDPVLREMVSLHTRIRQLEKDHQAESSRLENRHLSDFNRNQIMDHLDYLSESIRSCEKEIRELMSQSERAQVIYNAVTGLKGIGPECGLIVATMGIESFSSAPQSATFIGLNPVLHRSGKYIGTTRLSKMGDSSARCTFVQAARSAIQHNELFKSLYDRLKSRGLKHRQALSAVARKLVMICWAIARNALLGLPVFYPGGETRGRNLRVYCRNT